MPYALVFIAFPSVATFSCPPEEALDALVALSVFLLLSEAGKEELAIENLSGP